jgi:signal peptidase II
VTVFAVVATISIVLDRITKSLAELHLASGPQPFIPGFIDFMLVYNTGAAWGIFNGARTLFIIIASVTVVGIVAYLVIVRLHSAMEIVSLGLIGAGAVGNAIDRALTGRVVDFIHPLFIDFPLFNIADSSITVGFALFLLMLLLSELRYRRMRAAEGAEVATAAGDGAGAEGGVAAAEGDGAAPTAAPVDEDLPAATPSAPADVPTADGSDTGKADVQDAAPKADGAKDATD